MRTGSFATGYEHVQRTVFVCPRHGVLHPAEPIWPLTSGGYEHNRCPETVERRKVPNSPLEKSDRS